MTTDDVDIKSAIKKGAGTARRIALEHKWWIVGAMVFLAMFAAYTQGMV